MAVAPACTGVLLRASPRVHKVLAGVAAVSVALTACGAWGQRARRGRFPTAQRTEADGLSRRRMRGVVRGA
jgi:hypothetical protein